MGLAAFNRMRREQADREAAEKAKLEQEQNGEVNAPEEEKEPAEGENDSEAEAKTLTPNVEEMDEETIKAHLLDFGVKFAHNTGLDKLKEKLKSVLEG